MRFCLNDGSTAAPRLRCDLNLGNLAELPPWSTGPQGNRMEQLQAIKAAGYEGIQAGDEELPIARSLGLAITTGGRINQVGEIRPLADQWAAKGYQAATLHVGWGFEDDALIDAVVDDILNASAATGLPLFIETHRATITQDMWRTVQLVKRHPDVRFNGDFSHWWTGLEFTYGDIPQKMAFIAPVLERVRFFHGRCGNHGHIQVPLADPSMTEPLKGFRELWTRSMVGFLAEAGPGDVLPFNPELLSPLYHYAREFPGPDGVRREESDRWTEALALVEMAKACWTEAQARHARG